MSIPRSSIQLFLLINSVLLTQGSSIISLFNLIDSTKSGFVSLSDVERVVQYKQGTAIGNEQDINNLKDAISTQPSKQVNRNQFNELLRSHSSIKREIDLAAFLERDSRTFTYQEVKDLLGLNDWVLNQKIFRDGKKEMSPEDLAKIVEMSSEEYSKIGNARRSRTGKTLQYYLQQDH